MYTVKEASALQQQAKKLKLKYPAEFVLMTPAELARIANGFGPERWPEVLRTTVNWFFRHYPVPAAIHDVRYEFSDGRESTRHAADAEFAVNLRLAWQQRYKWQIYCNPVAWYAGWKIRTAAELTARFGRAAWRASWLKKRRSQELECHE